MVLWLCSLVTWLALVKNWRLFAIWLWCQLVRAARQHCMTGLTNWKPLVLEQALSSAAVQPVRPVVSPCLEVQLVHLLLSLYRGNSRFCHNKRYSRQTRFSAVWSSDSCGLVFVSWRLCFLQRKRRQVSGGVTSDLYQNCEATDLVPLSVAFEVVKCLGSKALKR